MNNYEIVAIAAAVIISVTALFTAYEACQQKHPKIDTWTCVVKP